MNLLDGGFENTEKVSKSLFFLYHLFPVSKGSKKEREREREKKELCCVLVCEGREGTRVKQISEESKSNWADREEPFPTSKVSRNSKHTDTNKEPKPSPQIPHYADSANLYQESHKR